jgi:hypothetical protein
MRHLRRPLKHGPLEPFPNIAALIPKVRLTRKLCQVVEDANHLHQGEEAHSRLSGRSTEFDLSEPRLSQ